MKLTHLNKKDKNVLVRLEKFEHASGFEASCYYKTLVCTHPRKYFANVVFSDKETVSHVE